METIGQTIEPCYGAAPHLPHPAALKSAMHLLFHNDHWMVSRDGVRRLIVVRRTPRPYGSASEVEGSFQALETFLIAQDRRASALLIDTCAAPLRNDPEFMSAAASHPRRFVALGFAQLAVLARTATGRTQAQQLFRERGFEIPVLTDEREAMAFLTLPPSSRSPDKSS
ncbi:hypothetical protein A7982_12012 [Minicystis rosea]|nr:hypothetical protein A7982_12012 [Minicystis rosea]